MVNQLDQSRTGKPILIGLQGGVVLERDLGYRLRGRINLNGYTVCRCMASRRLQDKTDI